MRIFITKALILGLALSPSLSWAKISPEEELLKGIFQIKDDVQKNGGKATNEQLEKRLKPLIESYTSQAKFDEGFIERFLSTAIEKGVVSPVQAEQALQTLNSKLKGLDAPVDQATAQNAIGPFVTEMLNNTSGLRLGRCGGGTITGTALGFGAILVGIVTDDMKDGTSKNMAWVGTAALSLTAVIVFTWGAADCNI